MKNLIKLIKQAFIAFVGMVATIIQIVSDMIRGLVEIIGNMCTTLLSSLSKMLDGINKNMKKKKPKELVGRSDSFSIKSSAKPQQHEQ